MTARTLNLNPYELALLSEDISSPDSVDSPGANFLLSIQTAVNDALEYAHPDGIEDLEDAAHEIADSSVPVYTHQLFETLVDLAAYTVEVDDFGQAESITQAAQWALYQVARDIARHLLEEAGQ